VVSKPTDSVDQSLILATWKSVTIPSLPDYPERYFGLNGFYYENLENSYGVSFHFSTYYWGKDDTLVFGGIKIKVLKLTKDSLVFALDTKTANRYRYINERKALLDPNGHITTLSGAVNKGLDVGTGGPASLALIGQPYGITVDHSGNIYFMDNVYGLLREITAKDSIIHTVAGVSDLEKGSLGEDGLPALSTHINAMEDGITVDNNNNLYFMQTQNNYDEDKLLYKLSISDHIMHIICGKTMGYSGDGGPATQAAVYRPGTVKCDAIGNVYFSDQQSTVIRKVSADGTISTIAGNATLGYSGDGGPAKSAMINVGTMAIDNDNNIIFSNTTSTGVYIRKVDTKTGLINTLAGNGKTSSGDGLDATKASFYAVSSIAVGKNGDIFIGDNTDVNLLTNGTHRIRKISKATNIITTVAGNDYYYFSGDGIYLAVRCMDAHAIAIDNNGDIIVSDQANQRIRKILL